MNEQQGPVQQHDHDTTGWIILGALLIAGGFFLGANSMGLVPWQFREVWDWVARARWGIGVAALGIILIIWATSGRTFTVARRGTKLYRSRNDKWLAGVLGGLSDYFGIDATLMRLAFLALVLLLDLGGLVAAYIVMAIVVPQEPKGVAPVPQQPAWPAAPAPPAPPAPPVAPATPAPPVPDAAAPPAAPVVPETTDPSRAPDA